MDVPNLDKDRCGLFSEAEHEGEPQEPKEEREVKAGSRSREEGRVKD